MSDPMRHWPAKDAPMREWVRPLSSLLNSPGNEVSSTGSGLLSQRINKKRRKRAANLNLTEFGLLNAQGVSVAEMATRLGVSTRSVERAKRRRDD